MKLNFAEFIIRNFVKKHETLFCKPFTKWSINRGDIVLAQGVTQLESPEAIAKVITGAVFAFPSEEEIARRRAIELQKRMERIKERDAKRLLLKKELEAKKLLELKELKRTQEVKESDSDVCVLNITNPANPIAKAIPCKRKYVKGGDARFTYPLFSLKKKKPAPTVVAKDNNSIDTKTKTKTKIKNTETKTKVEE